MLLILAVASCLMDKTKLGRQIIKILYKLLIDGLPLQIEIST